MTSVKDAQKEISVKPKVIARASGLAIILASVAIVSPAANAAGQAPAPDNTKANAREHQTGQLSADQQNNGASDVNKTRDVRKAIIADKSLSTYAHNVKIITQNGTVTLKGPVRSSEEKSAVELKAAEVVGASHVVNQLSIVPTSSSKKGR